MGFGAMVARSVAVGLVSLGVIAGGNYALDAVRNNAPIESGFVNPKSLSIEGKKNAAGNIESTLQYRNGEATLSLPCTKGYSGGALCGGIDYWLENLSPEQKERVVVGQWPQVSNDAKYGIMKGELQTILDSFYGAQKGPQAALQQPYGVAKQK